MAKLSKPITLSGRKTVKFGTVSIDNGRVTEVEITDGGAGYASAASVLTFSAPTGISFAGTDVGTATNTIDLSSDVFALGDIVQYSAAGNAIGGLSAGQSYYIIDYGPAVVQLANTYTAAVQGSAVDLTSPGSATHFLIGETASGLGVLSLGGEVMDINITDPGCGYSSAPVVTAVAPSGRTSTLVISPEAEAVNVVFGASGTFSGTVVVQGSIDNEVFVTLDTVATATNTVLTYEHPMKYMKANLSTYGSGAPTVKVYY
jgi:hypothetical protein